jgi:hypothetical protein
MILPGILRLILGFFRLDPAIAEELSKSPKNWCAAALAEHSDAIMLVAISVSHLESHWDVQLELPLDLADEKRRPGIASLQKERLCEKPPNDIFRIKSCHRRHGSIA